jgi:hypothetical protein
MDTVYRPGMRAALVLCGDSYFDRKGVITAGRRSKILGSETNSQDSGLACACGSPLND